jgi:pumilio family protein 6
MAGIKRKSAVSTTADVKTKSKKVKVEKSAPKSVSKHAVKPVKKSKKVKEESPKDMDESNTSEKENGFNGFSANEDADMNDSDADSEDDEPMGDVTQNGKAHKRKSEDKTSKDTKKLKSDPTDQSAAFAAANGTVPTCS